MVNQRNPTHLRLKFVSVVLILTALGCNLSADTSQPADQPADAGATSALPAPSPTLNPTTPPPEPTEAPPAEIQPTEVQPTVPEPTTAEPTPIPPTAAPPTPEPTQAVPAFAGAPCEAEVCQSSGSFFLQRPIGPEARNTIVVSSRFGEYNRASKSAYHGVYFLNSTGTPVLAAADGVVVMAGDDSKTPYGPYKNLYGNLVIIKHELPGLAEPLFTLYGHLSEILVQENDAIAAGQEIGKVGMSGDVSGSTLLFEVRLVENSYLNVRNPELWLEPLSVDDGDPAGALAGRILDSNGDLISAPEITVEQLAGPGLPASETFYLNTYAGEKIRGQYPWGENFAAGDLPSGLYQITFWLNGLNQREVEVLPGQLTLVTFRID